MKTDYDNVHTAPIVLLQNNFTGFDMTSFLYNSKGYKRHIDDNKLNGGRDGLLFSLILVLHGV